MDGCDTVNQVSEMVLSSGLKELCPCSGCCECCALLKPLSLSHPLPLPPGCSGGTEAAAQCEEAAQSSGHLFVTERLSVDLEAVDRCQGSTRLKPMPVV